MTEPSAEALLQHAGFLRALARSLLYDEGQAEDVVQETYLAALRRPPPEGGARSWLAAVTRNLALKRRVAEGRLRRREAVAARTDAHPAADDVVSKLELHRLLVDAVHRLDEPYRAAIVHRYFEELPPREIAARLGIHLRAVETRLRRALERLRCELDTAHAGDRRAWSLPLLALLPLPRGSVPATLLGVLMGKTQLFIAGAIAVACFVAGWSLKPRNDVPARATREASAAASPDPETARLKEELVAERARAQELEAKLKAATVARAEVGGAGGPEDATPKGPRFLFPEYQAVLSEIDWEDVGTSTAKLAPLLAQVLDSIEKTGTVPPTMIGEIQKWNAQLVPVAIKVQEAGVPGTGANGSFTHPAVDVNVIDATLKASGNALSAEQEARLEEVGRRYAAEAADQLAAYPDGTLALRRLADEAALKDRFYAEVDGLLTEGQRDFLHPEAVRGYTKLDLFSSGIVTFMETKPLDMKDREAAVKRVTDKHMEELGLDPATRPVVEQLVGRWAERAAETGLDGPWERNVGIDRFMRAERIRKAAQLQLELWDELQRRVALTDEQRKKLARETNIIIPFR